jgi:PAS domain S-box-containing protein
MLLRVRTIRSMLEGAERCGIDVDSILSSLDIDRASFSVESNRVAWSTVARISEAISVAVDGDVGKLRAVGRVMNEVPGYAPIRRIARSAVSIRTLYQLCDRWVAPANFPNLRLSTNFGSGGRIYIHGLIPKSQAPSEAFMQISCGAMTSVTMLLGLPPCEIVEARIDERSLDLELAAPQERSLVSAGMRAILSATLRTRQVDSLEEQRTALFEGLGASQRARDELRIVLERLPDLVVIHVGGRIVFANGAFVRTLGWPSAEELLGRPLIEFVDPRSRALFAARMALPPDLTLEPVLAEAWLTTRDGTPVLIEVGPAQGVVFGGLPARLVFARDVAERDRLRQRLVTADRLASLGLLAAGVAHEVNNPLGYVLNNIEIAKRQLAGLGPDAEMARTALEVALEGVDRIRFIVRELLFLARAETAPVAPTDLASAVQSTLALARIEIARTAKLVVELDAVGPVCGSVPRIAQIVLNLVLNALEAMSARDPARNELSVRVRRAGDSHALLEITDNGAGVTAKDESRLFDPFFTTKSEGHGTGLGLTITQRLVAELGGEVSFTTEEGRGTTFRVLFALYDEDRLPRSDVKPAPPRATTDR